MRFYNQQHRFYCGVDLHARTLALHILDAQGETVLARTIPASPQAFLQAVAPYRETKELIIRMGEQGLIDPELQARRLAEAEAAAVKFSNQAPPEALKWINPPWPSKEMIAAVYFMTWRFLTTGGTSYFMTSDNPVFFFTCYGLKGEEAELVFPISSDLVFHGCWQPLRLNDKQLLKAPQQFVKEFNRRIANPATRFLFYRQKAEWIRTVAQKADPYLSRFVW
jgi:hypothetical protein